ncbi:MAG TPA: PadR family transcriptional regulator [Gaiellaceae bacterium]
MKGHLDLLILAALGRGPAHGYLIVESLKERSGGVFGLAEGTVYPALHRLERAGLLTSSWSTAPGRRRRVYRLTARGRKELRKRADEWRTFSGAVQAVVA